MCTTEIKLPLHQAQRLANRLVELLAPHCTQIDIVGSVRRKKDVVGDIEIICEPKKVPIGLFGDEMAIIPAFFQALSIFKREVGNVENAEARYFKYEIPTGWTSPPAIKLDIFIPQPHDYYRQMAIRTGSSSYSKNVIANGWRALGWVGTEDGLRLEAQVVKKGENWVCIAPDHLAIKPPIWKSEREFIEWLNVPYVEPNRRI